MRIENAGDHIYNALQRADVTFAPGLRDVAVGRDDSLFSAVERLFTFTNDPINTVGGEVSPQRQGLAVAAPPRATGV